MTVWISSRMRSKKPMPDPLCAAKVSRPAVAGVVRRAGYASRARFRAVAPGDGVAARLHIIFVELVLDRINQGLPARIDHIAREPHGAPSTLAVGRFDQHAHPRTGTS